MNDALIFVKPHACTEAFVEFLERNLKENSIEVVKSLSLTGPEVASRVDAHYALLSAPFTLPTDKLLPAAKALEKFEQKFGEPFSLAVSDRRLMNGKDFCDLYTAEDVHAHWESSDAIKVVLAPGVIVARLPRHSSYAKNQYVVNGFYEIHRQKLASETAKLHFLHVQFSSGSLSWKKFRSAFVGKTNPALAEEGSIRNQLTGNWKSLNLPGPPSYGENGVHASAGPLEAARELSLWFGKDSNLEDTDFYKKLLSSGKYDAQSLDAMIASVNVDLYDATEDQDVSQSVEILAALK